MFANMKLIVFGLAVVNISIARPLVHHSDSTEEQAKRYNYTNYPNIGTYKFHTEEVTWNAARQTCEDEGGHLAVINSVAESKLLAQLLTNASVHLNYRYHAHIGFHEPNNGTDWVTIHGDSLAIAGFDTWEENEPSRGHGNTEHCGSVGAHGKLNDVSCTKLRSFICELPYASNADSRIKEGKARHLTIPDDYSYTPNIGAHKVYTQEKTWNDARRICIEEGGNLAVVNSYMESRIISELVVDTHSPSTQYNVHIGFHDLYKEGQFVTIDGVPLENVGFNEWAFGNPSGNEDCGALTAGGKLNDVSCDKVIGFVCELAHPSNAAPRIEEGKAWPLVRRNDYIYTPSFGAHKVHTEEKKWEDARRICIEEGGNLAVINTYTESRIITDLIVETNSPSTQYNVHIGFHDLYKKGQFVTIDGVPLENMGFNQWAFGNPSGNEDCGALTAGGQLNDVSCDKAVGFVCELPYI